MKSKIALLFYWTMSLSLNSQTPTTTPNSGNNSAGAKDGLFSDNVAPSINSPTANTFKKNIQYPEVSNRGSVDISLPIYLLQDRDLSLSILLSYDPNSVKVNQKASWVGTGWNLLGTGAITRTVKDLPDDACYMTTNPVDFTTGGRSSRIYLGFLNNDLGEGSGINEFPTLDRFSYYNSTTTDPFFNTETPFGLGVVLNEYRNAYNITRDLEPDIYTFSFNGEHFDFVFNENGEPKILGLNDYKIEYNTMHVNDIDIGAGHYTSDSGIPDYSDSFLSSEYRETTILSAYGSYTDINKNRVITQFIVTNPSGYKYYFDYEDTEKTQTFHKKYLLKVDTSFNNPIQNEVYEGVEPQAKHITAWYLSRIVSPAAQQMLFSYNDVLVTEVPKNPKYLGFCETALCTDKTRNKFQILDDTNYDRRSRYEISSKYISEIETDNIIVNFQAGTLREDSQGGFTLGSVNIFSKISDKSIYTYDFDYSYTLALDCSEVLDPTWCKRLFLNKVIERHGANAKDYFDFEYNSVYNLPSRFSNQQDFWGYYNANGAKSLIPKLYVYPNKGGLERHRIYPNPNEAVEYILPGADRSINESAILSGILKKIIFDTKGDREYIFEPHEYYDEVAQTLYKGGGLRIKKIIHNDGNGNNIVKTYDYLNSGKLYANPVFGMTTNYFRQPSTTIYNYRGIFKSRNFTPAGSTAVGYQDDVANEDYSFGDQAYINSEYDRWDKYTKRSSHPFNEYINNNGSSVLYTNITEYISGNGYTVHEFYEPTTYDIHQTIIQKGFQPASIYGNVSTDPRGFFDGGKCSFTDGNNGWLGGPGGKYMFNGYLETNQSLTPAPFPYDFNQGNLNHGTHIFPPMSRTENNLQYFRDKKKSITVYNEGGLKVEEKQFQYQTFRDNDELVYGIVHKNYEALCSAYGLNQNWFALAKYHYVTNAEAQLSQVVSKTYDQGDNSKFVEKIDRMFYEQHPDYSLLTRKTLTDSKGDTYETKTYYPTDDTVYVLSQVSELLDAHRINIPIKLEVKKDGKLLVTKENEYRNFGDNNIMFRRLMIAKGNNTLEEETVVDLRDEYGNILQYHTRDNVSHVILWDYNKSYPVMIVDNITYSQLGLSFQNHTGQTLEQVIAYESESSMISWQNNVRTSLVNDGYDIQIKSFTYDPLVGITSITDSRGYTTYYDYDDFHRLRFVKDNKGNILSENRYNYKN